MKKPFNLFAIARFTAADELHNKSFYILLGVCVLFMVIIRGCYKGDYVVNGQTVEGLSVAWHVALGAYHGVAMFGLLAALILANRSFGRDRANGMASFILSRPVSRSEYAAGKVLGLWTVAFAFMFLLHLTVFIMTLSLSGGALPMLPVASLVTGLNVLFAVCLMCLLSLVVPEFVALVSGVAVLGVGYISDTIYAFMQGRLVQTALAQSSVHFSSNPSWWRILWPKVAALQFYGSSIIQDEPFVQLGPLHPALNVTIFTIVLFGLLLWRMQREEL